MIILCGHGNYGETVKKSLEMIAGQQDHIKFVAFNMDMSVMDIIEKYNELISNSSDNNISIFCDIPGGSPANAAMLVKKQNETVRVFTGLNLPMMLAQVTGNSIEDSLADAKEAIREL